MSPGTHTSAGLRSRVYVAISEALTERTKIRSTKLKIVDKAQKGARMTPVVAPPSIRKMISNLKDEVISKKVVLAKEALKKRDKQADESYSDYKMALKVIVQRAYNSYDQTEVDGKVLERFLDGLGKAGRAVRLQAPTTVEDTIANDNCS